MSKQTAVEWFWNQLPNILPFSLDTETAIKLQEANEQAKAIEREQRFKDFQGGFQAATDAIIGANKSVQSKTYGKEASHEG